MRGLAVRRCSSNNTDHLAALRRRLAHCTLMLNCRPIPALSQLRWERAKELYLRGDINHEQYEAETRLYEAGANDLTGQTSSAPIALGDVIRNFAQEWARALLVEKRKLLRFALATAFERGNTLVAIQPTPALFLLMSGSLEGSQSRCGDDGRHNTSYFGIIIVDLSATMPITI